jgi:hypothetical protein
MRALTLLSPLLLQSMLWGCNDSEFDFGPTCDKGTADCGCIADQHCLEGLVCAQGVCLPRQDGTGGTSRGEPTSSDDDGGSTGSTSTTGSESTSVGEAEDSTSGSEVETTESTGAVSVGPYGDCQEHPNACEQGLQCVEIDPGGRLQGAMCTTTGCNGSQQCETPTEGTAQPFCLSIPPPTDDTVCVLNCADGAECPDGMQCHALGLGIEICG